MNPEISVILPVYNASQHIRESIQSILDQSMKDFELIIIDDGSTDNSMEIINRFTDNRIRLLPNKENKGLIFSLNKGIDNARGKYIARMDADDISLPDRFRIQFDYLEKNTETGVIGSAVIFFGDMDNLRYSYPDDLTLKAMILFRNPFHHPTVMMRKSILTNNNIRYEHDYYLAEDYALWIRLLPYCKFRNIETPLIRYRLHSSQESKKNPLLMAKSVLLAQKIIYSRLQMELSQKEEEITTRLYNGQFERSNEFIQETEEWLLKLIRKNNETRIFDSSTFSREAGRIWFLVCTTLASDKIRTKKNYYRSALANYYQPGLRDRIKFQLKNSILNR